MAVEPDHRLTVYCLPGRAGWRLVHPVCTCEGTARDYHHARVIAVALRAALDMIELKIPEIGEAIEGAKR